MTAADLNLTRILNRLQKGHPAEKNEVKYLLGLSDPYDISLLFETARNVRTGYFGSNIFLYGFLFVL